MSALGYDASFPGGAGALAQYQLVKTPAGVVESAADTDDCLGIVQDGADASATHVKVRIFGVTRAIAGAAIAKGVLLMATSAGEVIAHDGGSDSPAIGFSLEAAGAQSDEVLIFLNIGSVANAAAS